MRYTQPQSGPAQIDWSNPITRGLVIAVLPGFPINLVGSSPLTPSSGYAKTINVTGVVSSTEYLQWPEPASSSASGAQYDLTTLTAFVFGRQTSAQNASATFARGQGSSTTAGWSLGFHGGSNNGAYAEACGSILQPSSNFAVITAPTAALLTLDPVGGVNLYCNGKFQQSATYVTPTYQYSPGSQRRVLFGSKNGAGNASTNQLAVGLLWNRVLSATEIASISANPWQLFKSPQRVMMAAPAGIQFDAAFNSGYRTGVATYTFNRTVTGANTFLAVDVEILSVPGTTVTSVLDDGIPMVFIGAQSTVTGAGRIESWGIVAPTAGTKTITVTLSATVNSGATSVSYTGVHQSLPTEAFNGAQASNAGVANDASVIVTTVADNCYVHAAIATDDTAITANQVSRNNISGAMGSGADEDNGAAKTPAGAVTMSYTGLGTIATWAMAGYAIRPLAASGGAVIASTATSGTSAAATLSTSIPVVSAASITAKAGSTLTTAIPVSASSTAPVAASSTLSTQVAIASTASSTAKADSTLTTGNVWAANAVSTSSAGSTLSTAITLSASATALTSAVSALTTANVWAANAVSASAAGSALTTQIAIAAAARAATSADSALTVGSVWAASAISTARASATLTTAVALSAIARASTSASSSLAPAATIAADARATTFATVTLTTVVPPAFGPISITRKMIFDTLRAFLIELATPQRVIRTPVNRAAMPKDAYVAMTPGATFPLATPTVTVDGSGNRSVKRSSQFNCQIDCYGPDSGDLAELITMLFREQYAVEKFAASGLEIAPLYASDARQMPLVTGEEQYLERWTFELSLQFNPIVSTVQQSANMLSVGIISVDEAYPPQP